MIQIIIVKTGKWRENCYIINNNKYGIIIDPGGSYKQIKTVLKTENIYPKVILNTHAHYDHIGAVENIKRDYNAKFFLHSKDNRLLKSANLYKLIFESEKKIKIPSVDFFLDEMPWPNQFNNIPVNMIETPGHTMGSVCFDIQGNLFSGDTIFEKDIGRFDLPGGDKTKLIKSLKIISKLSKDLIIYPGHGEPLKLNNILENNKKLKEVL